MVAPRPTFVTQIVGDTVDRTVSITRPTLNVHDTMITVLGADAAISAAATGWTEAGNATAGGFTWTIYRRVIEAGDLAGTDVWTYAAGTLDPVGVLFVYQDVSPGTLVGEIAAGTDDDGTSHAAPAVFAGSPTYEELCIWYSLADVDLTPPLGVEELEYFIVGGVHGCLLGRVSPLDAVPTLPARTATSSGATGTRMLSIVIRDGLPPEPPELVDLVPGNLGLLP